MTAGSDHLPLSLGGNQTHNNRSLFSDHYLENLLPAGRRWEAALPVAGFFLAWLQDLYLAEGDQLAGYNESQLEDHWIRPVLKQLGHAYEGQAGVPGLQKEIKRPDYVFFADESARQAAVGAQRTEEYVDGALAVGEVKAWEVPLGKKLKGGGPSFEDQNPSYQIDYYLKATGLDWGILSNGRHWRLVHKDSSQRLTIYYEVDLVDLLERGRADQVLYFTLFFRQASFLPDSEGRLFLDDALAASKAYAVAVEEDLQENVYQALEWLMRGFLDLPGNDLRAGDLRAVYDNSLYLLYRLLFIFYAESRELLPMHNRDYREHYSLRDMANEIARENAPTAPMTTGNWGLLQNLFHIINGDNEDLNRHLGVPRYNGGLFNPGLHPFLEEMAVGDQALVKAVDLLARRQTPAGREFVDYRTLGVRQLGSIYEGLLEYQPRLAEEAMVAVREGKGEKWLPVSEVAPKAKVIARREAGDIYLVTDKGERKATGSYYTPDYIVQYIVENTLGPLVEEATERVKKRARQGRTKDEKETAAQSLVDEILSLKVLDPAMGSGHFLVAATDYLAVSLATDPYVETEVTPEEDVIYWKRRVVERCIYGVDKNPLAVELAKLSLWLATVAADQPLSFLDHHLKCGDSLIGADVADLGWEPPIVLGMKAQKRLDQQKAGQINLFEYRLSQQLPAVMGKVLEIVGKESDSYESIRAKEAAGEAIRQLKAPFVAVADLWTSAYFGHDVTPADYGEALDAIGSARLLEMPAVQEAGEMARQRRFFHWRLAFPEVFYDVNGQTLGDMAGFDAVAGNPPYVRVQVLRRTDAESFQYLSTVFATASGSYDLYMLFVERARSLTNRQGFAGFILPNKFLTASYGLPLRDMVTKNRSLLKLINFAYGQVFEDATTYTCLLFTTGGSSDIAYYAEVKEPSHSKLANVIFTEILVDDLNSEPWTFPSAEVDMLFKKLASSTVHLGDLASRLFQGIRTSANEVYVLEEANEAHGIITGFSTALGRVVQVEKMLCLNFVRGEDISRFGTLLSNQVVIVPYEITESDNVELISLSSLQKNYPLAYRYFKDNEEVLKARERGRLADTNAWHGYIYPKNLEVIKRTKLLTRDIVENVAFTHDWTGRKAFVTGYGIVVESESPYSLRYLLAILNSRFGDFALKQLNTFVRGGYVRIFTQYLEPIPICKIVFSSSTEERERLLKKGQKLYARFCENGDLSIVLNFVERELAQKRSDVVHDLLAFLAQEMIEMNQEKQGVTEDFWLDLEGVADPTSFDNLRHKGKWESTLWKAEACRLFVDKDSRSTRHLDDSLGWNEESFKAFVKALAGSVANLSDLVRVYRKHHPGYYELLDRIGRTDYLIDQIVYQLYDLTEEEIFIVEGNAQ